MSLSLLLIPYGLFLIGYTLWSIAMLYHLFRYGSMNTLTVSIGIIYVVGSLLMIAISINLVMDFGLWSEPVPLLSI